MEKGLILIYHYFARHKVVFYTVFICCFLFLGYFSSRVKFEEDISKVIPKDKKINKLNEVFQNSKFLDKLVIMVALKDSNATAKPDSLVSFADEFANNVGQKLKPYIGKTNFKVDDDVVMKLFGTISQRLPIYLNEKDYQTIDTLISPEKVKQTLAYDYRTLTSPAGIALKSIISNDPVGISFIALKKLQQLQYDKNFELYDNYVVTKDHKNLLMFITPAYPPNNTGKNGFLIKGLDQLIDSLSHKGTRATTATYFGSAAVYYGNALQLRRDTALTQGATVVALVLFLGLYFRKKRAPIIILIPVLFGSLFSLTAIYFLKGSISVIALGTGSVVLGIAINYSLHVFNHYRHTKSVEQVLKDLVMPLTVGSFTTIGGFLCLEFVESEMLKDLGLFAAFSLIGASICSLVFLPQFIATKKEQENHSFNQLSWIDKLASFNPEYNKYIVIGIMLLTGVFFYKANDVTFEFDVAKMNYMPPALQLSQNKLNKINQYALQSVYLVSEGKTLDRALINNEKLAAQIEKLKQQNIVKRSSDVSSFIISDSLQKERVARWNAYWTTEKKQRLLATLEKEGKAQGFSTSAFEKFRTLLNTDFSHTNDDDVAEIRKSFLDNFINEYPSHSTVVTLVQTSPENKAAIYKAFENDPNVTVIDKQYLTNKLVQIINADFTSIAVMSSALVFIVLLLTYGRMELALVSFIPMAISWIWILGLMGIFGIGFNIVNIIISALIFGLGDDYSLYIMDGLLQEYKTGKKVLSSYKSSIFLSAITTITGLGVLIFAKHPALRSIAAISIIGILCVVIMSQILIPFLFNILIKNRTQKKQFPWTISGFAISIFAFTYFVTGCIILSLLGFLFKLNPFNKEKGKLVYHHIMARFSWSMIYIMGNVKKEIIDEHLVDFKNPSVIIANHQSFLDILILVMLNPRLILFTNNWVWNSPVFGAVVRMADYFPVTQGTEANIDLLAGRVKQGYSIVIFPEGTRSVDGDIKRFHKGAFYLAEQLGIDIQPILIHGTGYCMTKGDFLLKNGRITLKYLPRITPDNTDFGTGYSERTKAISKHFKAEYKQLCQQVEQPRYYREQLIYNYLYKGPILEWYMRIKVRFEKNYQPFHELLPLKGRMLDIGCGYGFMPYMLHFAAPGRNFTGIDYDEDKIEVANNNFNKDSLIRFEHADALHFEMEPYDAIIIADVLHYMQPDEQKLIMERCMNNLKPGGSIIIRDGNKDLKEKHRGTELTEFFSTKFVKFNKASRGLSFLSAQMVQQLAAANNMQCQIIDETKYTSNIIFVIKK
ncbi:trifunctional MMPL family transporter/lysophospholipid acyltransferase/class I SAM-dependent methyltransferase [Mucilaginibacter dorajii]|uniref:MMPL family transporter n=1 Tax=Mucilaginibacter dorajii TaxID=692994 RepID=A0ABP7P6P1_9SPHI|nr:trifunctional MMPL family transporter/lysophospholipid acyltransferase/class I SAM-dependent methyltransferase [Mucilaginibacter dorajii]MCS3736518.1 1-acyl-sn-glycerol-3-phosphate acyltransferase [Mucilaginibacter dorajii]